MKAVLDPDGAFTGVSSEVPQPHIAGEAIEREP
jgi:hypothetical protein